MVILGHHEVFIQVLQYILALIAGGWICFKWLFPMLGRGIVNLCKRLENVNHQKYMERERERVLGQKEPKSMYKERWVQEEQPILEEYFETESQIAKVLSKKADPLVEQQKREDALGIKRRADNRCVIDGLYMTQDEIRDCYDSLEHI